MTDAGSYGSWRSAGKLTVVHVSIDQENAVPPHLGGGLPAIPSVLSLGRGTIRGKRDWSPENIGRPRGRWRHRIEASDRVAWRQNDRIHAIRRGCTMPHIFAGAMLMICRIAAGAAGLERGAIHHLCLVDLR